MGLTEDYILQFCEPEDIAKEKNPYWNTRKTEENNRVSLSIIECLIIIKKRIEYLKQQCHNLYNEVYKSRNPKSPTNLKLKKYAEKHTSTYLKLFKTNDKGKILKAAKECIICRDITYIEEWR